MLHAPKLMVFLLLWCRQFEALSESGEKIGEPSKALAAQLAAMQSHKEDTSCGFAEEGQAGEEMTPTAEEGDGQGVQLTPVGAGVGVSKAVRGDSV